MLNLKHHLIFSISIFKFKNKMIKFNPEFEAIFGLASGIFLGMLSYQLFFTFVYIFIFEYFILCWSILKYDEFPGVDRIFINLVFLFGWIFSKVIYNGDSGVEPFVDGIVLCYNTFPN